MPARRSFARLSLLALALIAGGCGGPEVTSVIASTQARDVVEAALARGPMHVVIQGDPFAVSPSLLAERVLTTMRETVAWYASAGFTNDPNVAATPSLFIVWTFNGALVGAGQQCSLITAGGGPLPRGRIAAMASLCVGGGTIAVVEGELARATGPNDPGFTALIRQMTQQLLTNQPNPLAAAASG